MVEIDGSYGEGGGQILRSSLCLAALTGKPLQIDNIRASREQPGLRPQHLTVVKAIAKITQAELTGAALNARSVTLYPGSIQAGTYQFDIPTAGALTLVMQTLALPLSYAAGTSRVTLTGGTHVRWSPNYHYLQEQWRPHLRGLGFRLESEIKKGGFFPRGGGEVEVRILPIKALQTFQCTQRGALLSIRGFSGVANLEDEIATRQKHQALRRLYPICRDSKIKTLRLPSPGKGTFILLKASFEGCGSACFTALGAPGKPADHFLADQLLLPLSLIEGASAFRTNRITAHLLTHAHVIRQFLPVSIAIEGDKGGPGLVHVRGVSPEKWNSPDHSGLK